MTKRDLCLDSRVDEYWIVDLDARVIERWRPARETPELLRERLEWAPGGRDPLVIDVTALFDRVEAQLRMFSLFASVRANSPTGIAT